MLDPEELPIVEEILEVLDIIHEILGEESE